MPVVTAQGYVDAARMLQQEAGTPPGVDLGSITDRMKIRQAVQGGHVEAAIDAVNDLNPEVGPPPPPTRRASRRLHAALARGLPRRARLPQLRLQLIDITRSRHHRRVNPLPLSNPCTLLALIRLLLLLQ